MNTTENEALLAFVPLFTVCVAVRPATSLPVVVSASVVLVLASVVDVPVSVADTPVVVVAAVVSVVSVVGVAVVSVVGTSVVDASVVDGLVEVGNVPEDVPDVDVPDSESFPVPSMTSSLHPPASIAPASITTGPHVCAVRLISHPFVSKTLARDIKAAASQATLPK